MNYGNAHGACFETFTWAAGVAAPPSTQRCLRPPMCRPSTRLRQRNRRPRSIKLSASVLPSIALFATSYCDLANAITITFSTER